MCNLHAERFGIDKLWACNYWFRASVQKYCYSSNGNTFIYTTSNTPVRMVEKFELCIKVNRKQIFLSHPFFSVIPLRLVDAALVLQGGAIELPIAYRKCASNRSSTRMANHSRSPHRLPMSFDGQTKSQ